MRKFLLFFVISYFFVAGFKEVMAFDYQYNMSNGQTLYVNIMNSVEMTVMITNPLDYFGYGYNSTYPAPVGNLNIPSTIPIQGMSYTVVAIQSAAFAYCTGLTSVTIPPTVTTIGSYAFYGCSGISGTLNIPNSVTAIYSHAFENCSSLSSVNIGNNVRSVGDSAFYRCSGLTSVTIGTGVKSLGDLNFANCPILNTLNYFADSCYMICDTNGDANNYVWPSFSGSAIVNLNIGQNVRIIPRHFLRNCNALRHIVIPNSVKYMGQQCFQDCMGLERVIIGDSISRINLYCFYNDTSLRYVSIGKSVMSVEYEAFDYCYHLDTIVSHPIIAPTLGQWVFDETPSSAKVFVHCNANMAQYQARWNRFDEILELDALNFSAISEDPIRGSVTIMTAPTCTSPNAVVFAQANPGFIFDHWSNGATANPYALVVESDSTIIAYFVSEAFLLNVYSSNEAMGSVQVLSAPTPANPHGTVVAMPNEGFVFDRWSNGVTDNPYTLTLTHDTTLFAYFSEQPVVAYNLTAVSSDNNKGMVQVLLEPTAENPAAIVVAVPNDGFRFDHWSNNVTANPYSLTLTSDTIIIAYFSSNQGVEDAGADRCKVFTEGKVITIELSGVEPVTVYDIHGRQVFADRQPEQVITVPVRNSGIYIVHVGHSIFKVIVL